MNGGVALGAERTTLAELVRDEAAFRTWYDRALPRVFRFLLARCGGDPTLAEELTQQTFLEAIRHRDQFEGRSDVVTWLCAIGRRKLADHHRRRQREERRVRQLEVAPGPEAAWHLEDAAEVRAVLDSLPPDQRLALIYRYLDQLPVADIARLLGRSESAAQSLLARARDTFRAAYGGRTDA
ncbi:MAG TPA: RNA polymerase sigma factor [Candidatus Limnocylindria bacterium]